MRDSFSAGNMTGSILVAHPSLLDPNFRKSIIFLSHHNAEDGAIGLVLNRPLKQRLADLSPLTNTGLIGGVHVFEGGPVGDEQLLLASMQWHDTPKTISFRGFGNPFEQPEIPPEFQSGLRAFRGYAGWSRGQLEAEIAQKAWVLVPPTKPIIEMSKPDRAWNSIMYSLGPAYRLLAEAPDDPSLN